MKKFQEMINAMADSFRPVIDKKKTALLCIDLVNDGSNEQGYFKQKLNFDISLMQSIEPKVIDLIKEAKKRKIPVIGVQAVYNFEYIPESMKERFEAMGIQGGLALKGALGSEIIPQIRDLGLDLIVVKSHYSAFSPGRTFGFKPGNKEIEEYMKKTSEFDTILKSEGKKTMKDYFAEAQEFKKNIGFHLDKGGVIGLDSYLKSKGANTLIVSGASTHVCVDSTVSGASERGYKIIMPVDAIAAEGIPGEGFLRHFTYLSNQGIFKAELTKTNKLIKAFE